MPLNNPPQITLYTSGEYAGDNGVDRPIAHGLRATPRLVLIHKSNDWSCGRVQETVNVNLQSGLQQAVTSWNDTVFYVSNTTVTFNATGSNYRWVAFT